MITPEKTIEYTMKGGFGALAIVAFFWMRNDLEATKQDVREIQQLLTDCYKDQIRTLQPSKGLTSDVFETIELVAVLPEKMRICYEI